MSRMRDISKFLARTAKANTNDKRIRFQGEPATIRPVDSAAASTIIGSLGASYELTQDSLATSDLRAGQVTLVESAYDGTRLYLSNGLGWYNISLINLSPQFDSDVGDSSRIVDSNTSLVFINPASDSDNPQAIITYSGTMSDSGQYLVNLTQDSSVWTFDPLTKDSVYSNVAAGSIPDSAGGTFTYTFQASDGINTATRTTRITYVLPVGPSEPPITYPAQTTYGGQTYGYSMGGQGDATKMDRYSLSSDGNATDVGDLTQPYNNHSVGAGASGTYGYIFGGANNTSPSGYGWAKYQYASGTNVYSEASQTYPYPGNNQGASAVTGNRSKGYNIGGKWPSPSNSGVKNYYDRITYSTDTWATDVGDLTANSDTWGQMVNSSPTTQYMTGGGIYATTFPYGEPTATSIFSFPFASEGNTADIGYDNLFPYSASVYGTSASSTTYGYNMGGVNYGPAPDTYHSKYTKFPFSNNANSTEVGNLAGAKGTRAAGASSRTNGYMSGGIYSPSGGASNGIGKFPFSSDVAMSDIGDLTSTDYNKVGGQY